MCCRCSPDLHWQRKCWNWPSWGSTNARRWCLFLEIYSNFKNQHQYQTSFLRCWFILLQIEIFVSSRLHDIEGRKDIIYDLLLLIVILVAERTRDQLLMDLAEGKMSCADNCTFSILSLIWCLAGVPRVFMDCKKPELTILKLNYCMKMMAAYWNIFKYKTSFLSY